LLKTGCGHATCKPINTCLSCATAASAAAAAAADDVDAVSLAGDADCSSADTPAQRQSVAVVVYTATRLWQLCTHVGATWRQEAVHVLYTGTTHSLVYCFRNVACSGRID